MVFFAIDPLIKSFPVFLDGLNLALFLKPLQRRVNHGEWVLVFFDQKPFAFETKPNDCRFPNMVTTVPQNLPDGVCDSDRFFFLIFADESGETLRGFSKCFGSLSERHQPMLNLQLFIKNVFQLGSDTIECFFVICVRHRKEIIT